MRAGGGRACAHLGVQVTGARWRVLLAAGFNLSPAMPDIRHRRAGLLDVECPGARARALRLLPRVCHGGVEGARATCTAFPSCHHSIRVTPQPPNSLTMSHKAPPSSSESPAPCSALQCSRRPREQRVAPWAGGLAGRHAPHCASGQRTRSAVAGRPATLVTPSPTDPELPSPRRLCIGRSVSGNHPIFTIMILRHHIGCTTVLHHGASDVLFRTTRISNENDGCIPDCSVK
jgi:hypothetical protein